MELAIPLVALGGLYIISNQSNQSNKDAFTGRSQLPNIDIPDKNYPTGYPENPVNNIETDLTSKLSTVNLFDSPQVYTDRFFNPNVNSSILNSGAMQNSSINQGMGNTGSVLSNTKYTSMSGNQVDSSYFTHNNMVPFFGSKLRTNRTDANATESLIDNYTGAGSQIFQKKEVAPLFSPSDNYQWANGMPNNADFIRSRINPSSSMANVKPFQDEMVGPGLGLGYGTAGMGGYNSGLNARDMYREKTVDELRVANNPKPGGIGLYGHEGPAISYIPNLTSADMIGRVEKNRVERAFLTSPEQSFTRGGRQETGDREGFFTGGMETAPTSRGIQIEKNLARPDTLRGYIGAGANSTEGQLIDGEYVPSKHIDLGPVPIGPAFAQTGASNGDYGIQGQVAYPNNRTQNPANGGGYFGAVGGAMGAAIAPLLDMLRPSRRENTIGTLRPYQNPGSTVSQSYMFNPADLTRTTIRETTENSTGHLYVNANQLGGGYKVSEHQAIQNNRQSTDDFYYAGGSSAGGSSRQPRPYDAEYQQTYNGLKDANLASYTPQGGMSLLNGSIKQTAKLTREQDTRITREIGSQMPYQIPSTTTIGSQSSNMNTLYDGINLDRTNPDIMTQLKGNPFIVSHLNGL
jgi:hypothetical protein